jgi:DNA polymerase III gamma/tau subunit
MLIADMQDRTTTAVRKVVESLADYLWNDPISIPKVIKKVAGTDFSIPVEFSQDIREGDLLDYMVEIAPYSMQSRTPSERLQTISQMMTNFVVPMTPQLQQRGIGVNMDEFMKIMARYSNIPEMEQILERIPQGEMDMMNQQQGAGAGERPLQSPVTSRTTIRENVSGATRQGADQENMRMLMAMGGQGQGQGQQ